MSRFRQFQTPHSHVQSLDTGATPEDFAKRAVAIGAPGLTCTDHGTVQAGLQVYKLAKENNLTPILGLEAYFRDDNDPLFESAGIPKNKDGKYVDHFKYGHLTMHALDQPGYEAIIRLLSKADERAEKHGSERKPLFDWNNLEELGSYNITMTTGCLIGIVPRHILDHDDLGMAKKYFDKLKSIVKPGNLYTELFAHDCSKNWVSGVFITLADGQIIKVYDKKNILTNVGEIQAANLAKAWAGTNNQHLILRSIKDRSVWREMPETAIVKVEHIEDFLDNECRPWAKDGDVQAGINRVMRILAKQNGIKCLPSDDSHYATPDQHVVQDVRLAQSGNWKFWGSYHLMTSEEAYPFFQKMGATEKDFEGWIDNSYEWVDRFKDFKFETKVELPTKFYEIEYQKKPWYKVDSQNNSLLYIFELIKKHGRMDWNNPKYVERLKAEIKLFHENGTIDLLPYFMTAEEVCDFFESKGLLTGVARGSSGGTALTYLLGITHIDPIKYGLSLERFLTLDRISTGNLPDIDQDLPRAERDLLINPETGWLKQRFGDCYSAISTDSTLKIKQAVKDVSRAVRGFVPPEIEKLTKDFMQAPVGVLEYDFIMGYDNDADGYIQGSREYDPALKEFIKRYPQDWEIVQKCVGLTRQKSRHASAFVLANRPISDFIPLTTVSGIRCTAYTAKSVEAAGGIKNDYLGLNSLSDIGNCIKLIQSRLNRPIPSELLINNKRVPKARLVPINDGFVDIWDLPSDQAVFSDISLGKTETVFQLNTPSAQKWLKHFSDKKSDGTYGINSIESIAAFTALDRPGPLDMFVKNPDTGNSHNMLVEYARRARGATPSDEVLPIFDQLIPETNSVLTYQEQIQYIYQYLTECSGPEAENFRRDISKKLKQKLEKAYLPFIERAGKKIGEENAKAVWQFMETWSAYGFCKAHATAYGVTAYACAFLKRKYPLEWWTSVLKNADKNEVNESFWRYCGHLIDLPDVTLSGPTFEIQNERIRAPLDLLKGVGDGAHQQIEQYKPYKDILDFCRKMEQHKVDTGTIQEVTKTRKDKTDKYVNAEGKKVSREVEYKVKQLKKGGSAINRGVVQKLIISGAMDSLFAPDLHLGEKLVAYEQALADAQNEIALKLHQESGETKKVKVIKVEPVDPTLWDVGPLVRFQMQKQILPAIAVDLRPIIRNLDFAPMTEITNADGLTQFQNDINNVGKVVVVAHIDLTEPRKFQDKKTGESKEMCKVVLDVESAKFDFVRWSDRNGKIPDMFKDDLTGAIAIVTLDRYKEGKSLSIQDFYVIEKPLAEKEEKKVEPAGPKETD